MTHVPASSHGGSGLPSQWTAGSGGQLDIAPTDDTAAAIEVDMPVGATQDMLDLFGQGGAQFVVAKDGSTIIQPLGGGGNAPLVVQAGGALTGARRIARFSVNDVTRYVHVGQTANLIIKAVTAPPDAELAASELALWFDSTNGAVALGLKGKSANGTVLASTYPLRQASGALPTVAPVSGAAFQCSTTQDVLLTVPVTYNPGVATTATCKVELSPDNVTFSELVTVTQPVGTVFDGSIESVQLIVPAAWRVKLTVVNATLGTGTYY